MKLGIESKSDVRVALTRTRFHAAQEERCGRGPGVLLATDGSGAGSTLQVERSVNGQKSERTLDDSEAGMSRTGRLVREFLVFQGRFVLAFLGFGKEQGHVGHGRELDPKVLVSLVLGCLGVVYGDIGTSPLYCVKECMHFLMAHGGGFSSADVLGVLSMISWSLILSVGVKYTGQIMKADSSGEGGVFALLALLKERAGWRWFIALVAAGLLYGDGAITPAISVLSAIEGLEEIHAVAGLVQTYRVHATVAILAGLFLIQSRGTAALGGAFGRWMVIWFMMLAGAGVYWICRHPGVLLALSPHYAVLFFLRHKLAGAGILGFVVLAITGGEALYADMGHFGKTAIRRAWWTYVLPSLLLNYFGQGALILEKGEAALSNPFYLMFPLWFIPFAVVIATGATIIASQALISGSFSLTQQAITLGLFPRLRIFHTSESEKGQIYMPAVNYLLGAACIGLVIWKERSTALADAYGLAVTGTMGISTLLFAFVAHRVLGFSKLKTILFGLFCACLDIPFFLANVVKFWSGGWMPVAIAVGLVGLMVTWKVSRDAVREQVAPRLEWDQFINSLREEKIVRPQGVGIFLTTSHDRVPVNLVHHAYRNRALLSRVVLLFVNIRHDVAHVLPTERFAFERRGDPEDGFVTLTVSYGYMDEVVTKGGNVREDLVAAFRAGQVDFDVEKATVYFGRETIEIRWSGTGLQRLLAFPRVFALWMYRFMARNIQPVIELFGFDHDKTEGIEIRIRV